MYCCMWCSALGVVAVVLRSRCVVLCTACEFVSSWYFSSFSYMMHGHTYIKWNLFTLVKWDIENVPAKFRNFPRQFAA